VALYVINKGYGYLLGTVMQKVEKQKHKATDGSSDDYEVAWEYTSLEESVVEACYLSSAVIVGWHIESVWQPVSQLRRKRSRERPKAKNRSEVLRRTVSGLNSNFSDDKCVTMNLCMSLMMKMTCQAVQRMKTWKMTMIIFWNV